MKKMTKVNFVKPIHACNAAAFGEGQLGGERQNKLYNLRVAIVGTDLLGQIVLGCLYGLGIGNIYFMDDSKSYQKKDDGFLYNYEDKLLNKSKSNLVYNALKLINPNSNTKKRHGRFCETFIYDFNPSLIIDATNDPYSKEKVVGYALGFSGKAVPVISLASNEEKGAISCYWPKKGKGRIAFEENPDLEAICHKEFKGHRQGGFTSGLVAGLAVEDIRKYVFQYNGDDKVLNSNERIVYNIYSSSRKGLEDNVKKNYIPNNRKRKVLVVGAGALGNWLSIYLAHSCLGQIDFLDFDKAEIENMNRQIQLRGRISEKKAKILSDRIKEIDPYVKSKSHDGKICDELTEEDIKKGRSRISEEVILNENYDVIFGCVDNKYARLWLDEFCIRNKIAYIDGGSHPKAGQLAVYIPDITRSVNEQLHLETFSEKISNACDGPNPSVVMSNAIIAAAMCGELTHVFNYELNKHTLEGPFVYDTFFQERFWIERKTKR